ncbi:hypothetical protein DFH09DRAFT_1312897 [Mycena vulgaris]|nr:hypothetical protein DFH09DRAFT_1312897 [Mycena vulgaris]
MDTQHAKRLVLLGLTLLAITPLALSFSFFVPTTDVVAATLVMQFSDGDAEFGAHVQVATVRRNNTTSGTVSDIQNVHILGCVVLAHVRQAPAEVMLTDGAAGVIGWQLLNIESLRPTPTSTAARKHQRISSVVLSPSPSNSSSPSDLPAVDITLTLDDAHTPAPPLSAYHAALAAPQFWENLLAFLQTKLSEADAKTAFELQQIFVAIKTSTLTASQAAAIRNAVGITGMAGT